MSQLYCFTVLTPWSKVYCHFHSSDCRHSLQPTYITFHLSVYHEDGGSTCPWNICQPINLHGVKPSVSTMKACSMSHKILSLIFLFFFLVQLQKLKAASSFTTLVTLISQHSTIPQKTLIFFITAVETSNVVRIISFISDSVIQTILLPMTFLRN